MKHQLQLTVGLFASKKNKKKKMENHFLTHDINHIIFQT
jgi:hypothetical protein